jgi:hypothetical protein
MRCSRSNRRPDFPPNAIGGKINIFGAWRDSDNLLMNSFSYDHALTLFNIVLVTLRRCVPCYHVSKLLQAGYMVGH